MSMHTLHLIIVFALVATVFTAFLREWASPDLVALSAMGVLLVTGILSADENARRLQQQRAGRDRLHVRLERGTRAHWARSTRSLTSLWRLAGKNEWRALTRSRASDRAALGHG